MPLTPTQKKAVRAEIVAYTTLAEANRLKWHYSQSRPFYGYMVPPSQWHSNDCSGYVGLIFNCAMHKCKVYMDDPLQYYYTGIGNTQSMLRVHAAPENKYLVGDYAEWGPTIYRTSHTAICRVAGTKKTAIFSSNGHESWEFGRDAPNGISIANFPETFLGVWRHPALA